MPDAKQTVDTPFKGSWADEQSRTHAKPWVPTVVLPTFQGLEVLRWIMFHFPLAKCLGQQYANECNEKARIAEKQGLIYLN